MSRQVPVIMSPTKSENHETTTAYGQPDEQTLRPAIDNRCSLKSSGAMSTLIIVNSITVLCSVCFISFLFVRLENLQLEVNALKNHCGAAAGSHSRVFDHVLNAPTPTTPREQEGVAEYIPELGDEGSDTARKRRDAPTSPKPNRLHRRRHGGKNRNRKRRCRNKCQGRTGRRGPRGDPGPTGDPDPKGAPGLAQDPIQAVHYYGKVDRGNAITSGRSNCDEWVSKLNGFRSCDGNINYWEREKWKDYPDPNLISRKLGHFTIIKPGLYYIYAQVMFYNPAPHNTVGIIHRKLSSSTEQSFIRCTQSLPFVDNKAGAGSENARYHTCTMGAVQLLGRGDVIRLKHYNHNRAIDLRRDRSFIGFIRLAGPPMRPIPTG